MYREQEFVERCFCDAPAVAPCEACGRARCALHQERGLCMRCIERCFCDAPAVAPCEACGRARCASHRERGLCMRCTGAIRSKLARGEWRYYWIASTVFTSACIAALFTRVLLVFLLGFPLGFATYVALRRSARRHLIQKMGPALAASTGELLPESEPWDPPFRPDPPTGSEF